MGEIRAIDGFALEPNERKGMEMEKIFVKDVIGRDTEKSLLSHAILQCCNKEVLESIKGDPRKSPEEDERYIEVDFKMNGITVKLSEFLNHLEKQLDEMIKKEARDVILSKLNDVVNALAEIEHEAVGAIKKVVKNRLGVNIPEEW